MSLKLLHTADWHLGQTFFGYDRDDEQEAFLTWLTQTIGEEAIDVLLIAGDVFDVANPSAAAQRRFYQFLSRLHTHYPHLQVLVIGGNHDSAARLEAPVPLLEALHTQIVGAVKRTDSGTIDLDALLLPLRNKAGEIAAYGLLVPYLRQGDYPAVDTTSDDDTAGYVQGVARLYKQLFEYANQKRESGQALVALGHLHATGAALSDDDRSERVLVGGLESVPVNAFSEQLAYTALGHIHKAQRVGGRDNVRYAGSPLPMSFSEQHYKHQVVLVTLEGETATDVRALSVPVHVPLLRVPQQAEAPEQVLEALQALPDRVPDDQPGRYPYLEVRVLLTEPHPSFRHLVEEALQSKAVRLTAIVPSYPQWATTDSTSGPQTYQELQQIQPTDMLRYAFERQYNCAMPDHFESMFNTILREIEP